MEESILMMQNNAISIYQTKREELFNCQLEELPR